MEDVNATQALSLKKIAKLTDIKGKKVLVVGLGRTGVSLCHFLLKYGALVTISDHKSKAELAHYIEDIEKLDLKVELGGHTPKTFLDNDVIIMSPGISPHLKIFDYAKNNGVEVTGEFEFIAQFLKEPTIAVTGTNGKTTTIALINEMLQKSGVKVWVGGNYGAPVSEYFLQGEKADVVLLEVSSFMLEHVMNFSPSNVVFTNLAENHLDRHKSMEEYVNAKRRLFLNTNPQTISILNADDHAVLELATDLSVQRGAIYYFSRKPSLEPQIMEIFGAVQLQNEIKVRTGVDDTHVYSIRKVKMKGVHAIENIMAAILATTRMGATKEGVQKTIDSFTGLEHRLEYVRKVGGVEFYNDSKATNVHSVMRALKAFDENIVLIMGGKDTGLNYAPLREEVRRKVKSLIVVGEAKERINRDLGDFSETFLIGTFEEAVHMAYSKSRIGDRVLLSPGASSFDIFDDYRERGNSFKKIVLGLK